MKICVVFNIIIKKIKLEHPHLTSQILLECTSKSGHTAVSIEKYRFLMFIIAGIKGKLHNMCYVMIKRPHHSMQVCRRHVPTKPFRDFTVLIK
jgi:hypothetical protein